VKRGAASLPALLSRLGATDAPERQAVTDLLKQIGDVAVPPLIDSLASRDWRVALVAARTLGEIHPPRALDALTRASNHANWVVRESAVTALGKLRSPAALPRLRKALGEDRSPYVRKSAAFAMGEVGGVEVVGPLIAALADERGLVRETARASLATLDSLSTPALRRIIAAEAAGARARPPRAVALSIETLRDLGRTLPASTLRALIASPLWSEAEVRGATARMLGASREEQSLEEAEATRFAWAALSGDPDPRVRSLVNDLRSRSVPGGPGTP
jgi:HEAT repeat protein